MISTETFLVSLKYDSKMQNIFQRFDISSAEIANYTKSIVSVMVDRNCNMTDAMLELIKTGEISTGMVFALAAAKTNEYVKERFMGGSND